MKAREWPALAELFAALTRGATRAELRALSAVPALGELLADLSSAGWLVRYPGFTWPFGGMPTRRGA